MSSNLNIPDLIENVILDYLEENKECLVDQQEVAYCIDFKYNSNYDSAIGLPKDWKYNTSELGKTKAYNNNVTYSNNDPKDSTKNFEQWYTVLENKDDDSNNNGIPDNQELITNDSLDDYNYNPPVADIPDECNANIGDSSITLDKAKAYESYQVFITMNMKCVDTNYRINITDQNTGKSGGVIFKDKEFGNGDIDTPCQSDASPDYENYNNGLDVVFAADMNDTTIWLNINNYTPTTDSPTLLFDFGNNFTLVSASYTGKCNGDNNNNNNNNTDCNMEKVLIKTSTSGSNCKGFDMGGMTIELSNLNKNASYELSFDVAKINDVEGYHNYGNGNSEFNDHIDFNGMILGYNQNDRNMYQYEEDTGDKGVIKQNPEVIVKTVGSMGGCDDLKKSFAGIVIYNVTYTITNKTNFTASLTPILDCPDDEAFGFDKNSVTLKCSN